MRLVLSVKRRTTNVVTGFVALSGLAIVASCSLDLDESLIGKDKDGGFAPADGPSSDGDVTDGGTETSTPNAPTCAVDADCVTTDGCLKGKCDPSRKTCVY